jgi:hypothetical protein
MNTTDLSAPDELQGTGSMRSPVENAQRFTPLNISNGTPFGVPTKIQGQPLPTNELKGTLPLVECPISNLRRFEMIFSINGAKHKTTIDTIQKPIPKYPTQYSTINRTKTTRPETVIRESQPQMPIVGFTNMFQRLQSGSTCSVCDK